MEAGMGELWKEGLTVVLRVHVCVGSEVDVVRWK